jgi:hypothetical protein
MNTEYRVTFKSMFGTALVLLIIACLLIGGGILYNKPFLFLFGLIFFAWPFAVCYRLKIVVDDNRIVYTAFCTKV